MKRFVCALVAVFVLQVARAESPLVFQSDFGTRDAAVASMKGVAVGVSADIPIYDLTHEIPPYSIWEGSLRLVQAAEYWPEGTVFVSVVDPGVGTERKSIVMRSKSGHFFVTPDNGTLTFISEELGVDEVREIDEAVNRLANSEESYTFHGRDVYAYTGARLAAGIIGFEEVGRKLPTRVISIPYQKPVLEDGILKGNIPILDVQYGNVWTNIDRQTFLKLGIEPGATVDVRIQNGDEDVYEGSVPYHPTFGYVEVGEPLLYLNSLNNVSLAINQGDFADTYNIQSGASWNIEITK
ncbi:MAG TPA: S-adenosyl-l-methionine hydroxide adenosyltransferase family protein [Woeseiaceae bacterium]|nr:S-adenosyl-l-methionine hydroxide adenosyltransferase family protein [Woeseiaceae bacterium]